MNKNIICDECHNAFSMKIKSKKINTDLKHNFIQCPKCKKKYTVSFENEETKDLNNRIKVAAVNYQLEKDENKSRELFKIYNNLVEYHKKLIKKLDFIYNKI
jgi:hypothetical protein